VNKKFFIFSLPRSGSAWLSQFLSQPGSFCFHEPFADAWGWENLHGCMMSRSEPCVGAIDTSAYQKDFVSIEDCQYYVLRRDVSEIAASLNRNGWWMDLPREYQKLETCLKRSGINCIEIHHKWFCDMDYLKNIWDSIVGAPFDKSRTELLREMNVQRNPRGVIDRLVRCRTSR
jgi:hypothetical protein